MAARRIYKAKRARYEAKTRELTGQLNRYFESQVNIPRIKRGKKQEIETLINEEALLFAEFLRNETKSWRPRIAEGQSM
jgi:hypothetical protein